jgi:hypothetical protein
MTKSKTAFAQYAIKTTLIMMTPSCFGNVQIVATAG